MSNLTIKENNFDSFNMQGLEITLPDNRTVYVEFDRGVVSISHYSDEITKEEREEILNHEEVLEYAKNREEQESMQLVEVSRTSNLIKEIEQNDDLDGFEVTLSDDRTVYVQFEKQTNRLHADFDTYYPEIYEEYSDKITEEEEKEILSHEEVLKYAREKDAKE